MKETIEKGIIPHLEGQISLHKANIEIYMKTPAGIGDHPCIMQAIEKVFSSIRPKVQCLLQTDHTTQRV